jgi:hypothetical protein
MSSLYRQIKIKQGENPFVINDYLSKLRDYINTAEIRNEMLDSANTGYYRKHLKLPGYPRGYENQIQRFILGYLETHLGNEFTIYYNPDTSVVLVTW